MRFSASFAFAADVAMLTLGGYLKKKENLSARLGDVLSCMYLASMVLKHHENQGAPGGGPADRRMGLPQPALPARRSSCTASCATSRTACWPASCACSSSRAGCVYSAPGDRLGRKRGSARDEPDARRASARAASSTAPPSPATARHCCRKRWCSPQTAGALEKRIRVEGVKTGKVTALDLPGRSSRRSRSASSRETEAAACATTTAR